MERRWTLSKTLEIDAAHRLPNHPGKCSHLHGHRWRITIKIGVDDLDDSGMVVDFGKLSAMVREMDHRNLNALQPFDSLPPTAEYIADYLAIQTIKLVDRESDIAVTVEETPGASVTCRV